MKHDPRAFAYQSTTWLVLRCASSKTMALARLLSDYDSQDSKRYPDLGAWTPVWKRQKRLPRSPVKRLTEQPAIPSFVFIPEAHRFQLPTIPGIPYSLMRFDDDLVRIRDHELASLRKIDTQIKDPVKQLPKIGAIMRFRDGPFAGLDARVIYCNARYAAVAINGFAQPIKVPPSLLQKK